MRVTVRLFARLRDIAGSGELTREAPAGANVARGVVVARRRLSGVVGVREIDLVRGQRRLFSLFRRGGGRG